MKEAINIAFFGTDDVSVCALEGFKKCGIVPDLIISQISSVVCEWAESQGLGSIEIEQLDRHEANLGIVVSYGKIIPSRVIRSFKYGILNIHPSLLPKLRGPSPIKSAILENLAKTGVSIMLLDEKMDHGPILKQEQVDISPRVASAEELRDALITKGVEILVRVLTKWVSGKIVPIEQDHSKATYTHKFTSEDAYIDLDGVDDAWRKIRALNPKPGTWTKIKVKSQKSKVKNAIKLKDSDTMEVRIKIHSAHVDNDKLVPDLITPEGKKKMHWKDFLNGNRLI